MTACWLNAFGASDPMIHYVECSLTRKVKGPVSVPCTSKCTIQTNSSFRHEEPHFRTFRAANCGTSLRFHPYRNKNAIRDTLCLPIELMCNRSTT